MNIFETIVLGIVEGITEFLPISSTGHLILTSELLNISQTEFLKTFEIVIQLGAILAIVFLYWKRVVNNLNLVKKILAAFIPTGIIGFILYSFIKEYLLSADVVLWALLIGGILLIWFEKRVKKNVDNEALQTELEQVTYKQAFLIGIFQSFAVIPGVSRAAATIVGGLSLGLTRSAIVEFSFLLAVPTMLAASAFDLVKSANAFTANEFMMLIVGFITAFIFALIAVKFLIKYIKTHDFTGFGIYRILLAIIFWLVVV